MGVLCVQIPAELVKNPLCHGHSCPLAHLESPVKPTRLFPAFGIKVCPVHARARIADNTVSVCVNIVLVPVTVTLLVYILVPYVVMYVIPYVAPCVVMYVILYVIRILRIKFCFIRLFGTKIEDLVHRGCLIPVPGAEVNQLLLFQPGSW